MSPGLTRFLGFLTGSAVSFGGLSLAGHLLRSAPDRTPALTAAFLLPVLSGLASGFAAAWPWRGAWGGLLAGPLPHALAVGWGVALMSPRASGHAGLGIALAAVFLLTTAGAAFLGAALETWAWRRKLKDRR